MVYEAWLKTQNNFQLKAWVDNRDRERVSCKLQMSDLKYSICGFHALYQHAGKQKHTSMSGTRLSKYNRHVQVKPGSLY